MAGHGGDGVDYERLKQILPNAASPKLKIFMSADIVGSTAYKQPLRKLDESSAGDGYPGNDWARTIQSFYDETADALMASFAANGLVLDDLGIVGENKIKFYGERPVFWKTIGDEIIFWKHLEHEDQIWLMLHCWMSTIAKVRQWLHKGDNGLDIKSNVWCAGFPVRNRAIVGREREGDIESIGSERDGNKIADADLLFAKTALPKSKNIVARALILEKYYREPEWDAPVDFIGSGIDVGFRIAKHATTRRMAISLDVAYLMALSILQKRNEDNKFDETEPDLAGLEKLLKSKKNMKEIISTDIGSGIEDFPLFSNKRDKRETPDIAQKLGVYYSGAEQLKGVLGGIDYPRFWINIEKAGSLDSMKTQLNADFLKPLPWDRLLEFCESFYKDRRNFVFAPFIDRAEEPYSKTERPKEVDYKKHLELAHRDIGLIP
jgi:hypothetical protein